MRRIRALGTDFPAVEEQDPSITSPSSGKGSGQRPEAVAPIGVPPPAQSEAALLGPALARFDHTRRIYTSQVCKLSSDVSELTEAEGCFEILVETVRQAHALRLQPRTAEMADKVRMIRMHADRVLRRAALFEHDGLREQIRCHSHAVIHQLQLSSARDIVRLYATLRRAERELRRKRERLSEQIHEHLSSSLELWLSDNGPPDEHSYTRSLANRTLASKYQAAQAHAMPDPVLVARLLSPT